MRKDIKILTGIFLITLVIRLFLAFSLPNFTYESYFHLRQVQHIAQTGLPLYQDSLSYGGREIIFLPFFHYLAALFNLLLPLEVVAKILPNLLLASLTILVYLLGKRITQDENNCLIAAGVAGFLPVLFVTNTFTPETLFLPLIFLTIWAFLQAGEKKKYLYVYLIGFIFSSFTSSATFLLLVGFAIYVLLSFIERKKLPPIEIELMVVSLFFYIWSQFLFYKSTLIQEGVSFIWQNIPRDIIAAYFPTFSLLQALLLVSIIPFLGGIYVLYQALFQLKSQKSFLLISLVISTSALSWWRLIQFKTALAFFGLILAIFLASFIQDALSFLQKTKMYRHKNILISLALIVLLATTAYPAITTALQQDRPTEKEVAAFQWLEQHTDEETTVLATVKEGHLLTYYSQRKDIIDDQFSLIPDVEQRFKDVNSLYITKFQTQALDLTDNYNVQYLVLTPAAQKLYLLKRMEYLTPECFSLAYNDEVKIYQVRCSLEKR